MKAREPISRRSFLKGTATGFLLAGAAPLFGSDAAPRPSEASSDEARPTADMRRWRGFNLYNMFGTKGAGEFEEHDFRWIAEWGFNFVRVPVAYQMITITADPYRPDQWWLNELDRGIDFARRYGLHVCLNLNRLPGHPPWQQPHSLWKDQEPLDAFRHLWESLAKRYRALAPSELSFNLINEPPQVGDAMSAADYVRVCSAAIEAIRQVSPERPINTDGAMWGIKVCPELQELDIGQSCHCYVPFEVSHYRASWIQGSDTWPEPVWPDLEAQGFHEAYEEGVVWNRDTLEQYYQPWFDLARQGVPIFCGETGAYSRTPHAVALAWLRDVLDMLTRHDIGWALWNFRGTFGILDSRREDVAYEDFHGHRLDRKLLSLLQEFAA